MVRTPEASMSIETPEYPKSRVVRELRDWIDERRLLPGEVIPSEHRLAKYFSVTRSSVSAALRELEEAGLIRSRGGRRRRVVAERFEPRVHVPQSLMANTIVVINEQKTPQDLNLSPGNPWFIEVGVMEGLEEAGVNNLKINPELIHSDELDELIRSKPRGVISYRDSSIHESRFSAMRAFKSAGAHVVVYGHHRDLFGYDRVTSDHSSGSYQLTKYLIDRGCSRILRYWETQLHPEDQPEWLNQRDEGYMRACEESGIQPLASVRCESVRSQPKVEEDFEKCVHYTAGRLAGAFRQHGEVDAIMAVSDPVAIYTASALKVLGYRPNEDISLAGYDDFWDFREMEWESTRPLVTVDRRLRDVGREMIRLLISRSNSELEDRPEHRRVQPKLIILNQS